MENVYSLDHVCLLIDYFRAISTFTEVCELYTLFERIQQPDVAALLRVTTSERGPTDSNGQYSQSFVCEELSVSWCMPVGCILCVTFFACLQILRQ